MIGPWFGGPYNQRVGDCNMPCCEEGFKRGDGYVCEDFGLEVQIVKDCGCASCDLVCCGKPLKKKG